MVVGQAVVPVYGHWVQAGKNGLHMGTLGVEVEWGAVPAPLLQHNGACVVVM